MRRATNRKIPAVSKDSIEQIATEIRYKLRAANIRSTEIDLFLFSEENKDCGATGIIDLIQALQKKPFFVSENESVKMARYLVEPQGEKEVLYNITLTNANDEILHLLKHAIGPYLLLIGEEKIIMHNQIRKEIHAKRPEILEVLRGKKNAQSA